MDLCTTRRKHRKKRILCNASAPFSFAAAFSQLLDPFPFRMLVRVRVIMLAYVLTEVTSKGSGW